MTYIPDILMPDEKVLFTASVHPAVFLPSIVSFLFAILLSGFGFSQVVDIRATGAPSPELNEAQSFVGMSLFYLSVPLFWYSVGLGLQAALIRSTTEFGVTDRRLIAKTGLIHRRTIDMQLPTVQGLIVRQGNLGRLLNFGTVTVTGIDGMQESFRAIAAPMVVRKLIHEMIEGSRQVDDPNPQAKTASSEAGG